MVTILLRPPFELPLHETTWQRPQGSRDFRITNRFDGPDKVNGGKHRAVDAGNFDVGDPVVAMAAGLATPIRHFDGSLGVEIEHRPDATTGRVTTGVWHLSAFSIGEGVATEVAAGQRVGFTGNSGPEVDGRPMPAHTHITLRVDGQRIDPEPHLFGVPFVLGNSALPREQEDDVRLADATHQVPKIVRIKAGAKLFTNNAATTVHAEGLPAFDAELFANFGGPAPWLCRRRGRDGMFMAPDSAIDRDVPFVVYRLP
jgi:murein DD-endopeptidase MepM/ murein hydrolase activator NlpD